ncbi:LOW QUALITY PROTEIN: glutamate receptor 3-like isoform X3 [Vespula squamosa]|uniref:Glutamate receptor 3-like isoform X3 n=1 Tax=Vespula squamosa TaxID=30214 RepID=A0ABD1ZYI6_VESSQ
MTTLMFKWIRALSRQGVASTNLYFSQLQESSYYLKRTIRPYYIALISNFNAINEFSLATSTFDMSSAAWLVIFIYEENGTDHCHNPPGNIFHLRFNTEMMVRCGTENILREWYSIDTNQVEIMDVATWSLEKGITKLAPDFLYERRCNLQGLIMRAVKVKELSFKSTNKDDEVDSMFGRILKELCHTLNFSFNIVSEVKEYGKWNIKEQIWSGGMGELYTGRADISISDFIISNNRCNAVDCTHPFFYYKNILVIREPENLMIQWSSHFLTFTHSVWTAAFGVLIVSSILLVLLKINSGTDRKIGYLFIDNLLEIWGIFCQQGLPDIYHKSSLRIVYFSIFILVIVFWAAYSAALISSLTTVIKVLPFDSFESFVTDGTYQLSVLRGTIFQNEFINSRDPFAKKVMELMLEKEKLPLTKQEGLKSVCKNEKLALYMSEIYSVEKLKIICNLASIDTGHVNHFAMILSKHNPFTDLINFQLQKFMAKGMMNRLKDTSFKKKSIEMIQHKPVGLISIIPLISYFLIGIVLSTCILIIEKCIFVHKRKNKSIVHRIPFIKSSVFHIKKKKIIGNIAKNYGNNKCARVKIFFIFFFSFILRLLSFFSEMDMTTIMFKWRRALSREGAASTNLYFSQLQESSYYLKQTTRPYYIALISNFNAINEFSLATSTFDMSSAVWLVMFIYEENGTDYCHNPQGNIFHLRFNTEMMVRCGTENILREWYSIDTNQIEINDVATWNLEKGITKLVPDFLYERRNNLKGLIMRAVLIKDSQLIMKNKDGEIDGIFGRIFKELCETLNFSFNIVSEVEEYGRWNPKEKTWSGGIEELYTGRADIFISDYIITKNTLNDVDFTLPILNSKNILVIREPENLMIQWSSHFSTFTLAVWSAVFGILIVSSILLILLKINSGTDRKIGYLFIDNLLEIWGIFCQQGLPDIYQKSSLRIVYFSIFILVIVFWAAYSAALISFLTSVNYVLPFNSLESFVADGTYQLAPTRGTAYSDKFTNSNDPVAEKILKLMLKGEELPITETEGFKRICKNRKLAIYTSDQVYRKNNIKIPCNVVRIETGHRNSFAMVLSKYNPFTDLINFQLQKFIDNGMINRLKDTSFKIKSKSIIKHQPVPLISVISLILFFSIGIVLSTCILIIEKCIFVPKGKNISLKKSIKNFAIDYTNRKCSRILPLLLLFLVKTTSSSELYSINEEQTSFIMDICKVYGPKFVVFLYAESIKEMDMTTIMFKWRRALSREGAASTNLYFSQLQESSYYLKQTTRPYYIALISNFNAINEFSLATSTFDMSSAVWLVIFIYEENGTDYCHNPPGNIFHLRFNTEMMVRCGAENILREWYSIDTNQVEIMDVATWSLEKGITKLVPDFLYERRNNLKGLIMRAVLVKGSTVINQNENGKLGSTFIELLRELCVALNFSFDIVSEVKEFGRWNPEEKTWTGAIAELYNGRADIALAMFSITNYRFNAVDFTLPYVITKNYLYIRKPRTFEVKWSSYFLTFTNSVWMAMSAVLIVASVLLIFLKIKNGTDRKIGHLLVDNFLEIWGIVCQQGLSDFSNRSSLRIAYLSIFFLVTIFWAGYSATLISFLTSVMNILPFDSLEDFIADGTYQLTVPRGTSYYDKFAIMDVATWSLEKGITKLVPDFLYERRNNLKGLIMRAVLVKDSQFTIINKDGEIDGVFGRIIKELCRTLNFSFNVVSEVEQYGKWNPKKKIWSGGIAELYYGRADISISCFIISNDRFNTVDFTYSLFNYKNIIVIQEQKNLVVQWSSHFLTFKGSVWSALFGILIVTSTFLILLKIKSGTDRKIGYLLIDNLLEIWDFSHRSSFRIVYFSIFILVIVFWAGYSAAVISILTSVNHALTFDSLESFAADGTYQLIAARGTAFYDMFANTKDPLIKKIMKLMLKEEKLPTTEFEGFERICKNGKLALYMNDHLHHTENLIVPCNIVHIETGHINHFAMILSKHNPFTAVINFQLQKFMDKGIMNRLKNTSFKKKSINTVKYQPVRLISVIPLISYFLIGIVLSTCILIIEKCIFVRKKKNNSMVHHMPSSVFYVKKKKIIGNIAKNYGSNKCARKHIILLIYYNSCVSHNSNDNNCSIFLFLLLFLPKTTSSSKLYSIHDEQTSFIMDISKYYGSKSVIFFYAESVNIFFIFSSSIILHLLSFFSEMDMTTIMFKWRRALSREGVASTNLYFSQLQKSSYYLRRTTRPYYIALISNVNAINEFSLATSTFDMSSAVWLVIFIYEENGTDYCHNPQGNIFHLRFNTEMMVRCGTENILREWYSIDTNQIEIMDVATWSLEKGITKLVPDFLYERRNNLKGLIMRAVSLKNTPFVTIKKDGELDGSFGRILKDISVTLNFSFNIVSEKEEHGRWISKEKTWSGGIEELYTGRADIALARFSISKDRLDAVDFTLPHLAIKNYLYIRKPDSFAVKWSSYFLTFTNSVWIAMFGVLIVATILLIFLKIKNGTDCKIGHLLVDNFLEIWGIFCQQGLADFTYIFSLRIAYCSIYVSIFIFWTGYSAGLISFLTTVNRALPFNSLEGFVADGTYQLIVSRGTAYYDRFANSKDSLAEKAMKLMLKEEKLPITEFEGFERVR